MITFKFQRVSVLAAMVAGSSSVALAQDVVNLSSVNFNDPVAAAGAQNPNNEVFTATATSNYFLATSIQQAATGSITRINTSSGTSSFGFRLRNSAYPNLFGDFTVLSGTFSANTATVGTSSRFLTGTLLSISVVSGSTWSLEAYASVTTGATVGAAEGTGAGLSFTLSAQVPTATVRETFTYSGGSIPLSFLSTTTSGTGFTATGTTSFVLLAPTITTGLTITGLATGTLPSHVRVTAYNSAFPTLSATWRPWNNTALSANFSGTTATTRSFAGVGGSITGGLLNSIIEAGSTWTFILDESTDDAPSVDADTTLSALSFGLTGIEANFVFDTGTLAGPFNAGGLPYSPDNSSITLPPVTTAFTMGSNHFLQVTANQLIASSTASEIRIRVRNSAYPGTWTMELAPGLPSFAGGTSSVSSGANASPALNTVTSFRSQNTLRGLNIPAGSTFSLEFWDVIDNGAGPDAELSNLRIRFGSGSAFVSGTPPTSATAIGPLDSSWSTPSTASSTLTGPWAAGEVKWYSFVVPAGMSGSLGRYVNIWTEGTLDMMIGIWDQSGRLLAYDDDSGQGLNSALSFGAPSDTAYTTTTISDLANNGRDGEGLTPGTYYVSVSRFATPRTYGDAFFHTTTAASTTTESTLRVMANPPVASNQVVTVPLNFQGAVDPFAVNRTMRYSVMQGTTTVVSSTNFTANAASQSVAITIPASVTGAVTIEVDGSQYLKRKIAANLSGSNQTLSSEVVKPGDVDNNGEVDLTDIDLIIGDYLGTGGTTEGTITDLDNNGEVDLTDIDIAIGNYLLGDDN